MGEVVSINHFRKPIDDPKPEKFFDNILKHADEISEVLNQPDLCMPLENRLKLIEQRKDCIHFVCYNVVYGNSEGDSDVKR